MSATNPLSGAPRIRRGRALPVSIVGGAATSHVVELDRRLVVIASNSANLDNPVQLEPLGNGQFRYVAPGGGGPVGEIVRFVEENGRVIRMITGNSYVERVQP